MKTCEQENRLTPFLLGDLPKAEADAFRQHLTRCDSCQELSRELEPVLASLSQAFAHDAQIPFRLESRRRAQLLQVRPVPSGGVIRWVARPRRWLAIAAGVMVLLTLVGSLVVVNLSGRSCSARLSASLDRGAPECMEKDGPVDGDAGEVRFLTAGGVAGIPAADGPGVKPSGSMREDAQRDKKDKGGAGSEVAGAGGGSDPSGKPVHGLVSPGRFRTRGWLYDDKQAEATKPAEGGRPIAEKSVETVQTPSSPPPVAAPEGSASILGIAEWKDRGSTYTRRAQTAPFEAPPTPGTTAPGPRPSADEKSPVDGRQKEDGTENRIGKDLNAPDIVKSRLVMKGVYANRTAGGKRSRHESPPDESVIVPVDPISSASAAASPQSSVVRSGAGKIVSEANGKTSVPYAGDRATTVDRIPMREAADEPASRAPAKPPRPLAQAFNPFVLASENRFSTFSIAVNTASYTLTRQALRGGALPDPEVVRTEEIVNAFDYGDAAPDRATFRVYVEGAPSTFGSPGLTLLRIGVKGKRLGREEQRPAILTFLIDASGSMSQPDRIGRARTALRMLLDQLSPADRVQIVAFADKASVALPPTSASDKQAILAAFDRLQCNGSTNLEDGMRMAYQLAARAFRPGGENRVILISDGVANLGADNAQDILRQVDAFRKQGVTCSVFGVGKGTYNDAILDELANKGNGVYRFLDSDEEVRRVFVDDLAATLNYIASDVKIQVEWATDAVRRYRQLGYERRALRTEEFRDDTVVAGQVGSGQCVTALYEIERAPAGRSQRLGTVRVRYRRVDTGAIEEIATPISSESLAPDLKRARPQMRLAACSAAFAERLRGSPYVTRPYADVARLLRPVALELSLDVRVKELLSLVEMAEGMSGGH